MNIGIDIKALYKGNAGIAAYIRKTLDTLQRIDAENRYFLFEKAPSTYHIVNPNWKKIVIPSKLPGTIWLMTVLPFHLSRYSIDVFWGPEQIIPCLFKPGKIIMVSTILDLTIRRFPQTMQTANYLINRLFLYRSVRYSRKILTISQCVKNDICVSYPDDAPPRKVVVTYPGKPAWDVSPIIRINRGEHLLFVGSLEPRKNLLNLLKALVLLKTRGDAALNLHIVGPAGWKNSSVYDYIAKNDLERQIMFRGYLSEKELIEEYSSCKAFIYPSFYEGFGLPVLEALMTDTLVLSSRETSMEEIAGEGILLFDPHDPGDIAEKISSVYKQDFDRQIYLCHKDSILRKFSWENTASQTLEALTDAYRERD
jgi:glycosyltransferase involved in cell wall biosynthesis